MTSDLACQSAMSFSMSWRWKIEAGRSPRHYWRTSANNRRLGIDDSPPSLTQYLTVASHFGRLTLEILGGPQSRRPDPVSSGALGVDPMPGGQRLQSFDDFQRVFRHQCHLPNGTECFEIALRQTSANICCLAETFRLCGRIGTRRRLIARTDMTGARCIRLIRRLSWLASRPAAPLPESCFKGADALRYRAARSRCVGQCVQHDEIMDRAVIPSRGDPNAGIRQPAGVGFA